MIKQKQTIYYLVTFFIAGIALSDFAFANKKPKRQAPTKEDYYTTINKTVTDTDLKKADQLNLRTIRQIKSILKSKTKKNINRFELILRLGELYSERHDYLRDQEIKSYEQAYDRWVKNGRKGREPKLSNKKSTAELAKSVKEFRRLVREFPRHKRTAAALFALGKTLTRLNDDSAQLYFRQLIKDHPKSKYIPDAHLAMAEYYFDKHQIPQAIEAYKEVLKAKNHPAYPYAVYKLGWSYYNAPVKTSRDATNNINKAITSFKLAIKLADLQRHKNNLRFDLRNEAIKDLVMVWVEQKDPQSAWAYFKKIGEKDSFYDMLELLGDHYAETGHQRNALITYQRLVRESPWRPSTPETYHKIATLQDSILDTRGLVQTLHQMTKLFAQKSEWQQKNGNDKALVQKASEITEKDLHRFSTLYHARFRKAKNMTYLKTAEILYKIYLTYYNQQPQAYDIEYYLADASYDLKKLGQAAKHYTQVAQSKKSTKYKQDAALNAIIAYEKVDASQKQMKLPPLGQAPKPIALPRSKKDYLTAIQFYLDQFPKSKDAERMHLILAQTYYSFGYYDKALPMFKNLINQYPSHNEARIAAQVVVNHWLTNKNWELTLQTADELLKNKKLSNKDLTQFLVNAQMKALYSHALALEKANKFDQAADKFLAYQRKFSWDKQNADRSLHNAAVNFRKIGKLEDAIEAEKKLVKSYPKSTLVREALLNIAQSNEALARYEDAAHYYLAFAKSYSRDRKAPLALYNAGVLYQGVGALSQATTSLKLFTDRYKDSELTVNALIILTELLEKSERYHEALGAYQRLAQAPKAAIDTRYLAQAKMAVLTQNHINRKRGQRMAEKLVSELSRSNKIAAVDARHLLAEQLFKYIDATYYNRFLKTSLGISQSVEKDIALNQTRLQQASQQYQRVIKLGDPEYVIAAMYRLAQMSEAFSQKLFNAPSPEGMDQLTESKFRSDLEKAAFKLKDEAYTLYEAAFKEAQNLEAFSHWSQLAYNKMAVLTPAKTPEITEQSMSPFYLSHRLEHEPALAAMTND